MAVLTELARRGLQHPNAVSFVKRAVAIKSDNGETIELPTWGILLLYVSMTIGVVAVSLVSLPL